MCSWSCFFMQIETLLVTKHLCVHGMWLSGLPFPMISAYSALGYLNTNLPIKWHVGTMTMIVILVDFQKTINALCIIHML